MGANIRAIHRDVRHRPRPGRRRRCALGPVFPSADDGDLPRKLRNRDPAVRQRAPLSAASCSRSSKSLRGPYLPGTRRDGVPDHHHRPADQADGPVRAGGGSDEALIYRGCWHCSRCRHGCRTSTSCTRDRHGNLHYRRWSQSPASQGQLSLGHSGVRRRRLHERLAAVGFDVDPSASTFVHDPGRSSFVSDCHRRRRIVRLPGSASFRSGSAARISSSSPSASLKVHRRANCGSDARPAGRDEHPPFALKPPGLTEHTLFSKASNYYLVLVVAIVSYVVIKRIVSSRLGAR